MIMMTSDDINTYLKLLNSVQVRHKDYAIRAWNIRHEDGIIVADVCTSSRFV